MTRMDKHEIKERLDRPVQRQDSLNDQLRDLASVAQYLGMYDAADFLSQRVQRSTDERKRRMDEIDDILPMSPLVRKILDEGKGREMVTALLNDGVYWYQGKRYTRYRPSTSDA